MADAAIMPWVRFVQNFDWKPNEKVMFAYRSGSVHLVKQVVAELAIDQGKAVAIERPRKEETCQREV